METFKEFLNEGFNLNVKDEYGKQIWNKYQKDIMDLVTKINKENYDGGSSEIVCGGLEEIFGLLSDVAEPIRKQMNPND
jgi:hypothetical protein